MQCCRMLCKVILLTINLCISTMRGHWLPLSLVISVEFKVKGKHTDAGNKLKNMNILPITLIGL